MEAVDALDHLGERVRERVLRGGLAPETRQEHARVEGAAVLVEEAPHRLAVARLRALHELPFGFELVLLEHGRDDSGERTYIHPS